MAEETQLNREMTQDEAKKELRRMMSQISEQLYCSGWAYDIEYSIWEMISDHSKSEICPNDMDLLHQLSTIAQGWWTWKHGEREATFVPMEEWLTIYNKKAPSKHKR